MRSISNVLVGVNVIDGSNFASGMYLLDLMIDSSKVF